MTVVVAKLDFRDMFQDLDGNLLASGKLYTYAANSTNALATYADSTGGVANANPTVLDSSGQAHIWLIVGTAYKFVFETSAGVILYTENGVSVADPNATATASQYADIVFEYPGGPPVAATAGTTAGWLGGERVARAISFSADFAGSYGFCLTNPTSSFVATVRKNATLNDNGTQIGTITISTSGVFTFATTSHAAQSLAIGDKIHVFGPATADVTIADFGFTLAGTLA